MRATTAPVLVVDFGRAGIIIMRPLLAGFFLRWTAAIDLVIAPLHRRLYANPHYAAQGWLYRCFLTATIAWTAAWLLRVAARNFVVITAARTLTRNGAAEEE
jgi:hypothetical protein